jgi:tetratricopeptide (TPR) repeat protein
MTGGLRIVGGLAAAGAHSYSLAAVQSLLGLSRSLIESLVALGFVAPGRGRRQEYLFSFQDVVLLRTAASLQAAKIPARKILRSLELLRRRLPAELPLSGLRISAVGSEIAVHEGATRWHPESGQLLMDFEVRPSGETVQFSPPEEAPVPEVGGRPTALDWYRAAGELEAEEPAAAEVAYRQAIRLDPAFVDPYLDLGYILCEAGLCERAVPLYRQALRHAPADPLLHFNLGVALEDLGLVDEAIEAYEQCMALAPDMADAHHNAARLHELRGNRQQAIRHFNEYRRLRR